MKKRMAALALAGCLLLSGCTALLERSYSSTTPHVDRPTTAEDPSVLRVENYRELVSAVLYLVSQRAEEGVIQLHGYDGDAESDLTAACLEVATEDPLGAYAVEYIKHELSRVVSYYQATLAIRYRRTAEQMSSMVKVTGTRAIRAELREALARFAPEVVLRVAYFSQDEESLAQLLEQVYYDDPATALGLPQAEINLYPAQGRERVVEILLTYPDSAEALSQQREELARRVEERVTATAGKAPEEAARLALTALWDRETGLGAVYDPLGGSTAYAALVEGEADSQGMALGYALLCAREGVECRVVKGELEGESRYWDALSLPGGATLYADPSRSPQRAAELWDGEALFEQGYRWPGGPEEPEEEAPAPAQGG